MPNMSYCRFRNTDSDLADCADDLERRVNGERVDDENDPLDPLSTHEVGAAQSLLERCRDLVQLVMEERSLTDLDDLTESEIAKFLAALQDDVERACADELSPTAQEVRR